MKIREEYGKICESINVNDAERAKVDKKGYELAISRDKLVSNIIFEEGILKKTDYKLYYNYNNKPYLLAKKSMNEMKSLRDITANSYNSSFDLNEKIEIQFNDSEVSISFENANDIADFIKTYGLTVDFSCIKNKYIFCL